MIFKTIKKILVIIAVILIILGVWIWNELIGDVFRIVGLLFMVLGFYLLNKVKHYKIKG